MDKFIPKFQVYIIKNDVNNMVYIGQTTNSLRERFNQHYNNPGSHVGVAMHEIGKEHFSISILDDTAKNLDELLEKEKYYIQKYNSIENGYNSMLQGKNGRIHRRIRISSTLSKPTKEKLNEFHKKTQIPIATIIENAILQYIEDKGER